MVQNRDILIGNHVAYQMSTVLVTLNDHLLVAAFSSAVRGTFVQHFTRLQLTVCSRGPSVTAGLFVITETSRAYPW